MSHGTTSSGLTYVYLEFFKKGGRQKKIFWEMMARSFPNFMKTINPQIFKAQQTPISRNMKKTTPELLTISDNRKIFKASRGK